MNLFQAILILFVRLYQRTLSPVLTFVFGPHAGCRYTPTCSEYALDAIRSRGALSGSWLALKRIGRCNPWGGCGHDPVPEKRKAQTLNIEHRTPNIERWDTAVHATRNTQHAATLNSQLSTLNHGTAAHGS